MMFRTDRAVSSRPPAHTASRCSEASRSNRRRSKVFPSMMWHRRCLPINRKLFRSSTLIEGTFVLTVEVFTNAY